MIRRALLTLGFLFGVVGGWVVSSHDARRKQAARQQLARHG